MLTDPVTQSWRKILRFSVHTLIVLVLVIGAGLGFIVRSAHTQRDAVAAIKSAGGTIYYDWEWNNGAPISGRRPWGPAWLSAMIGVDYFGHVTFVKGPSSMTPAADVMAAVAHLTQIQYLNVGQSYVTDADLVHLARLTRLEDLFLSNGQITDAGMEHLSGLTNLASLSLNFTRITDAGMARSRS